MAAAGVAHAGLPTDAGFGRGGDTPAAAGYAVGNHSTEAVNSNVLAARGAAVRNSYNGAGDFGRGWYGDHPGAWAAAGWGEGQAWQAATWGGVGAALGWADAQGIPYDYGTNVTYQDNEVYNGDQPVATADQYYQQAQDIAQSGFPPRKPMKTIGCRWEFLRWFIRPRINRISSCKWPSTKPARSAAIIAT